MCGVFEFHLQLASALVSYFLELNKYDTLKKKVYWYEQSDWYGKVELSFSLLSGSALLISVYTGESTKNGLVLPIVSIGIMALYILCLEPVRGV